MTIVTDQEIDEGSITAADRRIVSHIRQTPVVRIDGGDVGLTCGEVLLKLEELQHSGSFKARGPFLNPLTRDVPRARGVAASGGNPGAAVAHAADRAGGAAEDLRAAICSPPQNQEL